VLAGKTYYSHSVTALIIASLVDSRKVYKEADLMKRELEILALILKGKSNQRV